MRVLDLFSGIGGFSLGLERAGMRTIAFCEIDPVCRKVLQKHWPNVPIFENVKLLTKENISEPVEIICGGFPCQDISVAGRGAGLAGERSGLWYQFHRLIEEFNPKYVIIENVAALRSRGLDAVLGSLAQIGYDGQWHCIPASALGAPHQRDRVWILAYPMRLGTQVSPEGKLAAEQMLGGEGQTWRAASYAVCWATEPRVGGMAYGVPGRVDRLKQLGNAVVPQIPELIGRAIMEYERHE